MVNGVPRAKRRSTLNRSSRTAVDRAIEALERRTLFASISWVGAASGNFNNPANWSTGTVPGAADQVTISAGPGVVVTVSDAEAVNSLSIASELVISSPTPATASLTIDGGGASIGVVTSLQLGSSDATSSGSLNFVGSQTLGGGGSILFAGTGSNPNQITISDAVGVQQSSLDISEVTIHGSTGQVIATSTDASIFDSGTIEEDGGGKLTIEAGSSGNLEANGTVGATSGILDLEGSWSNSGTLFASGGATLDLGGTFTSTSVNSINASGGTVNITGSLTLNSSLNLSATTGSFNLDGGNITAGGSTLITSDGTSDLVLTASGGTLNGIVLGIGLPLNATTGTATILNGLNAEFGTLNIGAALLFSGSQEVGGGATYNLTGSGSLEAVGDGGSNPATLTIVSGVVIQGNGTIEGLNAGDSIQNDGTIDANTSTSVIGLHGGIGGNFVNSGFLSAEGGTLTITGQWVNDESVVATAGATLNLGDQNPATTNLWTNIGTLSADSSTVNLGGDLTPTALGNFNRSGGTVNLTGLFNLQGGTQTFDATSGSWNLEGGTLQGPGTVNSSGNTLALTAAGGTLAGGLTLGPGTPLDSSGGTASVTGGLTLTNSSFDVVSPLKFVGTQTVGGTGTILLAGPMSVSGDGGANPATLTIGTGIVVEGTGSTGALTGAAAGDSIVNDGEVDAGTSGVTVTFTTNGGTITNAGALNVVPGSAVSVVGNLITTATSLLVDSIDSTGAGTFDITGTATLAGTLKIGVANSFVPPQGTVYNLANFGASTGSFAAINGLTPTGAILTPATTANSFTLTATFGAFVGLRPTTLLLSSSNQNVSAGTAITFTADVSAPAGDGLTPTGTVTFLNNGVAFGSATVNPDETALLTTSALPSGRLMITATYSGDTAYAASASAVFGETIAAPVKTIGGLDPTFGTQGVASHSVGFTTTSGVAVSPGGQSIVVGTIGTAPTESFGVTRYNADGTLDTTFGSGGVESFTFGSTDDRVAAVTVLAGGQVLVAGTATTFANGVATGSEFALAEFNPDGTPDTAFGGGTGQVLTSFSTTAGVLSNDVVHAMVLSATGGIYLGGSSDSGGHGEDFAIAAFDSTGAPLALFNGNGKTLLDFAGADDQINSLAVQTNGDLVAAGFATIGGTAQIALARFLPTGILDKRFGTLGTVTTNVRGVFDSASSVVIQPQGQIVIGGVSATGSGAGLSADFVLARYTTNGSIDRTFGGGPVITSFGQPSAITQVVLQADGEIVASGKTTASLASASSQLDIAIARYTATGALDTTFNGTGKTIIGLTNVVTTDGTHVSVFSDMQIVPLDASSLGNAFNQFINSQQGVVATTTGGALLDAGNSGTNTVEAQLVIAGVDLVAGVVSALPAAVPGGMKGTATISIGENGTTLAKGTVTVVLQVATDAEGDGAQTLKMFPERISLRQGLSRTFKLAFVFPAGIPANNYFLLVTIDDGSPLTDLNANNNTALSAHTVNISPPTIILAGSDLTATTAFTPGKPVGISLEITNNGNILAHGRIVLELFLSTNDTTATGTQIAAPAMAVALAAGKSRLTRLKFALPKTTTAGTFNLLALLDPTYALGSTDHSDTLVVDVTPVAVG